MIKYQLKNYQINSKSDVILKSILYNNYFSFEKKNFLNLLCGNIIIIYKKEYKFRLNKLYR